MRCEIFFSCHLVFAGFTSYLNSVHDIDMPPDQFWFCTLNNSVLFVATNTSTMILVSMTFDRFYSIIQPHKAASFNTVKRAKITTVSIVIFSIIFHIPHLFITSNQGKTCVFYAKGLNSVLNLYYWISFIIHFALPFALLLIMNSFIIHTISRRSQLAVRQNSVIARQGQGQSQGQTYKHVETQIYVILLLVTFSFLILTTPGSLFILYSRYVDYTKSPKAFALFYLLSNVGQKSYYTNFGINFFLYVISGAKFRADLVRLFRRSKTPRSGLGSVEMNTNLSTMD